MEVDGVNSIYACVATNLLFFSKGQPTKEVWYWQHQLPTGVKAYSKTKPIQKTEFEDLKAWWHNREENQRAWKVSIADLKANNYNLDIKNPHVGEVEHRYTSAELLAMLHNSFAKSDELLKQLQQAL